MPTVSDSGLDGPLGAGTTLNFNGGTLEFTGSAGSTNRAFALAAGGGAVGVTGSGALTLSGSVTGDGNFAKIGTGTVILTGATNTVASYTISQGTLQIGDGVFPGSIGLASVVNNGTLVFNTPPGGAAFANEFSGTGALVKSGAGTLTFSGSFGNTLSGTATVNAGTLVLSTASGVNAIGGNLVIEAGGTVAYGTTTGQLSDHIPDTASIFIHGGTFGSGAGNTRAAPTAGVSDVVANVTMTGGTFLSGRVSSPVAPFTITNSLAASGGEILVQRAGIVSANSVDVSGAAVLNFDGGSAVSGLESRLAVGSGGIRLDGTTVNMNAGPSAIAASSLGSVVILNGNVTATSVVTFNRISTQTALRAQIDLNGADRTFNVTGTMTVGAIGATVDVVNSGTTPGGIIKTGPGNLVLAGTNTYNGGTVIRDGALVLLGTISNSPSIVVQNGATFDVSGATAFSIAATQTLGGNGTVIGNTAIAGTLSPGSGVGTLNFANSLTLGATAVSEFQIEKSASGIIADRTNVTGTLTYAGQLNVTATGTPFVYLDTVTLFNAASFAGGFSSVNLPVLGPNLRWDTSRLGID